MSGNGRPIGIRRSTTPMRRRRAAFRKIPAAGRRQRATTRVTRAPGFHARCLRAARIFARQITAAAIVRPRVTPSRSTLQQAMSASDVSPERGSVMNNDKIPEKPETSTAQTSPGLKRRDLLLSGSSIVAASALSAIGLTSPAQAQQPAAAPAGQQPNIVVIMGDDIGMWNIGAYHRGMMAGRTPNLDRIAAEGMLFTDYYAEASCTAGRANFITGELP